MTIYDRIKNRRVELNLTQDELAKKMGYKSRSSINKIELGKQEINQRNVAAFAKALNTTPSYLMGWEDEPTEPTVTDDPSVTELLEYFANRPDGKMLFSVAKDCTPEEIIQAVKIIEALKK